MFVLASVQLSKSRVNVLVCDPGPIGDPFAIFSLINKDPFNIFKPNNF